MLSVHNISYSIDGKTLLENISLAFLPGKLSLVIGPNGAGKSTLVKIISGQLQASEGGSVRYGDTDIRNITLLKSAQSRAVLSQNTELVFPLNVSEVVMLGRHPHFTGKPSLKDQEACTGAMRFFDVESMAGRDYMTLSGGEKQRVHFARVLAQIWYPPAEGCRYLILDEPLTFLDVHYQFDFMHKVRSLLGENIVIIGVVHDLNLAAKFADQIILLHEGKLVSAGDRETVLSTENIQMAYRLKPMIRKENGDMYLFFH
jgi:iron complex transport system ATP-binding protein